ncbi:LysR family transcriptional regulator [Pseudoalteromonas peptidolytica]|uniref:HTH lysR-type domain-containing protein n=1 Tax=Pseudoalteromonas peptidolytica F12-50-A1 TaxID=1315280 RepID=A0A8I0T6V0_9GAMM|nr:LysR family transcriptional regulator [Pseudoalteromonas peptidolytica]MBE0348708.1 hypothetical protein [Pseudoalteromonas peptidolytica F12-50-A1]NLR15127.1 LysR family transcriptional regulator [Pseudoalteromonas peptidolytica]GEK10482.1 LysR family transcriptional regulator [Pseudoalteromonas peptidolytica]
MKISDLAVFCTVVEAPSLTEAANKLHKTQPAVSQSIKRLEQSMGFALFEREKYRNILTEQGRRFYFEAEKLLNHHRDLSLLANEFAAGNEPSFNICYEPIVYQHQIDEVLGRAFMKFPSTEMNISSGKRFFALEQVTQGAANLGIGPWFDLFHSTGDLETMPIGKIKLGLVSLHGYMPQSLGFAELANYPSLAMKESKFNFDSERLAYGNSKNVMKLDDALAIKRYLLQGMGYALIGLNFCREEIDSGILQRVRVNDRKDEFEAEIHAFRLHISHHGPVARYFWEQLKVLNKAYEDHRTT